MGMSSSLDRRPRIFEPKSKDPVKFRTQFRYSDIVKAYDYVDLAKMREYANSLTQDWKNMLDDYKNTNLKFGNKIINRTVGLPQGGKHSPILFNYYLDKALTNVDISQDYIYADNLALFGTNLNDLNIKQAKYESALNNAGFKLEKWDHWNYSHSDLISSEEDHSKVFEIKKVSNKSNIPIENHATKRILGFNLSVENDTINIKKEDIDVNFKVKKYPPYKAMNVYKQKIEPKFKHQSKHVIDFNIDNIRRKYLRKMMAILAIPSQYFNANFKDKPSYWAKFLSLYFNERVYEDKFIQIPPRHNTLWFNRWLKLCAVMKRFYIPHFQMIKFIYLGRCKLILAKELTADILKHNAKLLDYAWYIITADWSLHTALNMMQLDLLNKLDKHLNKFIYKINYSLPENNIFNL